MSSNTIQLGSAGAIGAIFFYEVVQGRPDLAALAPLAAWGICKLASLKFEQAERIGDTIALLSGIIAPGTGVGYALHNYLGGTLIAKAVATLVGAGIIYKTGECVIEFAARSAAKAAVK